MSEESSRKMKFHIFRCMGIVALGIAAFFLAAMQSDYWDYFFKYLFENHMDLFLGFIVSLILAAIFLSLEHEKKE